jgi:hypothetical protein
MWSFFTPNHILLVIIPFTSLVKFEEIYVVVRNFIVSRFAKLFHEHKQLREPSQIEVSLV